MKLIDLPEKAIACRNLVGGEWLPSAGATLAVESPYDGRVIGHVSLSSPTEVHEVVSKAQLAFPDWRRTPLKERTQPLFRFRELMLENLETLSHRAAAEAGKTLGEARAGILKGVEVIEFALSLQNLDKGAVLEVSRGVSCQVAREPLGVVAGIAPFNFPAMVPLWMFPIAVTVGNCFVLKPSEKVPLTAQLMGELMRQAGYPPGVFSIVNGGRETVEALIDAPAVRAIGFVGSTPTARAVYARATSHGKRALCLGGAKNHLIVVPDADENITVKAVVDSFTGCAGQRCMAASLMIAVGDMEPLIEKIVAAARSMPLGQGMGAIIDKAALTRIEGILERVVGSKAHLRLDGRRPLAPKGYENGHWLAPTVIDQAQADMECARSEIFGPVLTIVRVPSLSEAMRLENANPYGNAISVFTTNGAVARYVADESTSGMVGVNIGVPVPREPFSFGGTKDSKFGQGDMTGESSLDFWSNLKKITTKWSIQTDHNWMS